MALEPDEPEIVIGTRAWAATQQEFVSSIDPSTPNYDGVVGWYDESVSPYVGSFAVVKAGSRYEDLVGDVVLVTRGSKSGFVYVVAAAAIPTDVALTRGTYLRFAPLSNKPGRMVVRVTLYGANS